MTVCDGEVDTGEVVHDPGPGGLPIDTPSHHFIDGGLGLEHADRATSNFTNRVNGDSHFSCGFHAPE